MENLNWLTGVVFPFLNFFIFIGLLIYFARKPAKAASEKKLEEFNELVKAAASAKKEAEEKLSEIDDRFRSLNQEIKNIRKDAKIEADEEAERIVEQAKTFASRFKKDAKRIAQVEARNAQLTLQTEMLNKVRAQVLERIEKEFDSKHQVKYISSRVANLEEQSGAFQI